MLRIKQIRGMTLIELSASLLTSLLLLGILLFSLTTVKRIWQSSITRAGNSQDMYLITRRIDMELQNTDKGTITDNTSTVPRGFSFLSAMGDDGSFILDSEGSPQWRKYVIYYIPDNTTKLMRREIKGTFTNPLTPAQLKTYCDGSGDLIAGNVTEMTLTPGMADNSAILSVSVRKTNRQGKTDMQNFTRTVYMRN